MSHDHFHIIRVRTTAVEWFVLTARDVTVDEAVFSCGHRNIRTAVW